jgi:hypothetical protein
MNTLTPLLDHQLWLGQKSQIQEIGGKRTQPDDAGDTQQE